MSDRIEGEVLHAIPPDELGEHDLEPELQALAESQYVLVCRRGGHPSVLQLVWAFIRRDPIEAVTIVTDDAATEGDTVVVDAEETTMPGVYVASDSPRTD